jgi:uncharacterized protein YrzB (UPF0473 family)
MTVEIGEELIIGDEGNEETFEVLYTCELNGNQYLVIGLKDDLNQEDEDKEVDITAFRYTEKEDGTIVYDEIESDEEWNEVESKFSLYLEQLENDTYSG